MMGIDFDLITHAISTELFLIYSVLLLFEFSFGVILILPGSDSIADLSRREINFFVLARSVSVDIP